MGYDTEDAAVGEAGWVGGWMLTVAAADIAKVISVLFSLSWAHFLDTGMIIGADLSPRNRARRHTHWVWVSTRGASGAQPFYDTRQI